MAYDRAGLIELKSFLADKWDNASEYEKYIDQKGPMLQSLPRPPKPRSGLAVGHSFDKESGEPIIEIRVISSKGRRRAEARELQRLASQQGFLSRLKFFTQPVLAPRSAAGVPIIEGRRRPLHIGSSVAHERGAAGTLGAFVEMDGVAGILSCVHVLAQTHDGTTAARGDPIQQPGHPDPVPECNQIADLSGAFAPFVAAQRNNLDAAIARLRPDVAHDGNRIPSHKCIPENLWNKKIGAPVESEELTHELLGKRVIKIGRTTGYTSASLKGYEYEIGVEVGSNDESEAIYFSGVHEILWDRKKSFTAFGDSGALIMLEEGLRPLGINFCATSRTRGERISYVVPWHRIAALYGIRLL